MLKKYLGCWTYKIGLLSLVLGFQIMNSNAQVSVDKSLDYDNFGMLQSTSNMMYTYSPVPKTFDQSELVFYNSNGDELNRIVLQAKRRPTVMQVAEMGDNVVFELSTGEFLVVDASGKEVLRKSFVFEDKVKSSVTRISNAGITVAMSVKIKKVGSGTRVIQYGTDLAEAWKFEDIQEKNKDRVSEMAISKKGTIALICKKGNTSDLGFYALANDGSLKANKEVAKTRGKLDTYYFNFTENEDVLMLSDYGSTSTEMFKGIPLGMNVMVLDVNSGNITSETEVSFNTIQELVGDKRTDGAPFYKDIAPALHMLDIVSYEGKSYFLCESYLSRDRSHNTPSTTPGNPGTTTYFTQMELLDYYLIDVENPNEGVKRVWKQPRVLEFELGSFGGAAGARDRMAANGLFSYQGMYNGKIMSKGYGQMHNYFTLIDIAKGKEQLDERIYWGTPIGPDFTVTPQRKSYKMNFGSSFLQEDLAKEGIVAVGLAFTLYQYDFVTNTLNLTQLKF